MRFISLELSAIGPYPGKVTIPFEDLKGISLVSGKTGTGKTFLFDAITYALYGKSSGDDRDADDIRSTYASPSTESYVTLVFEHDGGLYTVRRSPRYMRPKARGEGFTEEKPSAQLDTPDGRCVTKVAPVNEAIFDLVGLTVKQWRQVVMLAQGKFMDFLRAGSKERGEILESIFGIGIYSKMVEILSERSKDAAKAISDAGIGITEAAKKYDCEGRSKADAFKEVIGDKNNVVHSDGRIFELISEFTEADEADLKVAVEAEAAATDAAKIAADAYNAAKAVNDAFDAVEKAKTRLDGLSAKESDNQKLEQEIERARAVLMNVKPVVDRQVTAESETKKAVAIREESERNLEVCRTAVDVAKQAADEAEEAVLEAVPLRDRASKISSTLEKYDAVDAANKRLKEATDALTKCRKELDDCRREHQAVSEKVDGFREYLSGSEKADGELTQVRNDLVAVDNRLKGVVDLNSALTRYDTLATDYATLQKKQLEVAKEAEAVNTEHKSKNDLFIRGQAGLLSASLTDGEPCPVCGSVHHPTPAVPLAGCPTKAELDAVDEKLNAAKARLEEATAKVNDARERLGVAVSDVRNKAEVIGIEVDPGDAASRAAIRSVEEDARQAKTELLTKSRTLEAICARRAEINAYFAENPDPKARIQEVLDERSSACNNAEVALTEAKTEQETIAKDLEFPSKAVAEKEVNTLLTRAVGLEKAKEDAVGKLNKAKADLAASEERLSGSVEAEKEATAKLEAVSKEVAEVFTRFSIADREVYSTLLRSEEQIAAMVAGSEAFKKELNEAKGALEHALEAVEGKTRPENLEELFAANEQADQARSVAVSVRTSASERLNRNRRTAEELRSRFDTVKRDLKELMELKDLADVAAGVKDANGVIMGFADYVRSRYLDSILEFTKGRLDHMTNGRYELRRARDTSGGRSSHMLELEIVDHDAPGAGARSVTTLSGGESFKTALALALGFSDAIQEHAAGQRIDALFIDEGFGSLDEDESLDQALDVLQDLSGSSKTVCVISHVVKLRERIPRQILVSCERGKGSSMQIVKD